MTRGDNLDFWESPLSAWRSEVAQAVGEALMSRLKDLLRCWQLPTAEAQGDNLEGLEIQVHVVVLGP
jgi:hypothetical protein